MALRIGRWSCPRGSTRGSKALWRGRIGNKAWRRGRKSSHRGSRRGSKAWRIGRRTSRRAWRIDRRGRIRSRRGGHRDDVNGPSPPCPSHSTSQYSCDDNDYNHDDDNDPFRGAMKASPGRRKNGHVFFLLNSSRTIISSCNLWANTCACSRGVSVRAFL